MTSVSSQILCCRREDRQKTNNGTQQSTSLHSETVRAATFAVTHFAYPTDAITFSSIAIGVGSAVTSTVVRVGFGLPGPAKCSA